MATPEGSGSPEAADAPEVSAPAVNSAVTAEQWRAIRTVTDNVYQHREKDGHEPSKLFQRIVNKRVLPDYYDVIKEPVALSTIKRKLLHKSYTNIIEFVRDAALIVHNAQTYNRPRSGAFQDSLILKRLFQDELKRLVEDKVITEEESQFPDLGELPPVEASPERGEDDEEEEEDEEEDDEEEEEVDESDEDGGRRKKRRTRPSTGAAKRDGKGDVAPAQLSKRRGRPPKVDTPMEARIKNILRGIRRLKSDDGRTLYFSFEKLPDKTEHPHYYMEIKEPLALEQIKRKQKRKKYNSVDHFLRDMNLMYNNCKSYNEPESDLYKDASALQLETHRLAVEETAKPDSDFTTEEGRQPLPDGIQHNGETWRVGDWIHLQNPNDVTKPIVAQVYRTWQDKDGEKWINACWYYRPEQTVHQYEKHFFAAEVVKTGQYRDHRAEEIVDRCFVMFVTRFSRGRPRGLPQDKDVYVCESRYNEEKYRMNKIKTWASCLPDEVRDRDYEMDLFEKPRRIKKVPSPILHLLKDEEKESSQGLKPRWGAENAPPLVGAIYKGPRDENQSPPPERTPTPPPQPPPPVAKATKIIYQDTPNYRKSSMSNGGDRTMSYGTNHNAHHAYSPAQHMQYHQQNTSPAPIQHPNSYAQHASNAYSHTPDHYANAQSKPSMTQPPPGGYPRTADAFHLPENANLLIPKEVRDQFQQDEQGHVLFFTAPPVDALPPVPNATPLQHSAKFLAAKLRDKIALSEKRKALGLPEVETDGDSAAAGTVALSDRRKKIKSESEEEPGLHDKIQDTRQDAMLLLIQQMQNGTDRIYQDLYGQHWEEGKRYELEKLAAKQTEAKARNAEHEINRAKRLEHENVSMIGNGIFQDEWNPRY